LKFTFDVSKCDRIFDELLKVGNIKISHTMPPLDEIKRRAYCKFQNSYSHATNDCNVFRRQIQSVINEGRLMLHEMQVDKQPVNTKNWYRKGTDLWAEFGKEAPFGRKFSSKDSVKKLVVGSRAVCT
jgi:hypothetical protein